MTWLSSRTRPSSDETSARDPATPTPMRVTRAALPGAGGPAAAAGDLTPAKAVTPVSVCGRAAGPYRMCRPPSFVMRSSLGKSSELRRAPRRPPRTSSRRPSPARGRCAPSRPTRASRVGRWATGDRAAHVSSPVGIGGTVPASLTYSVKVQLQVKTQLFRLCSHMTQPITHAVSF